MAGLYFPHDINDLADSKLIDMFGELDYYGYGLYYRLICILSNDGEHRLSCNYKRLAKVLSCDAVILERLVAEFGLFTISDDGSQFWSERVLQQCQKLDAAAEAGKKGAAKRWASSNPNGEGITDPNRVPNSPPNMVPNRVPNGEGITDPNAINTRKDKIRQEEINTSCGEQTSLPPAESYAEKPKITQFNIILNDKSLYDVTEQDLQEWRGLYPAVDVEQELRNMHGWADANPKQRKTRAGIRRFITAWLSKAQDKARCNNVSKSAYTGAGVTFGDDNPMYRRD